MNANVNMPLWAFWDIYGHTTKIRLIGGTTEPYLPVIHNSLPSTSTDVGYQLQPSNQHQKSNTRNKNIPPELMRASQLRPGSNNTNATSKESETLSTNDKLDRNVEKGIQKDVLSNKEFVSSSEARSDCILCFENAIDCVIYTCGHMCMCYTCATNQWKKGGGFCPLCRTNIHDVIKTFKP
jgi:protein neuralized